MIRRRMCVHREEESLGSESADDEDIEDDDQMDAVRVATRLAVRELNVLIRVHRAVLVCSPEQETGREGGRMFFASPRGRRKVLVRSAGLALVAHSSAHQQRADPPAENRRQTLVFPPLTEASIIGQGGNGT